MLKRPYSTISIRNKNNTINSITNNTQSKMNIVTLNNKNNNNNAGICQSPKLKNGKMRYLLENKKLFSLLDLNEKITNSKGPSLPIQFKRLNSKEINDLFNADIVKVYQEIKKLNYSAKKRNLLNRIKFPKAMQKEPYIFNSDSKNKTEYEECSKTNDDKEKKNNFTVCADDHLSIEEKLNDKKDKIISRPNSSINPCKKQFSFLYKKNDECNKENKNIKIDKWMPSDYKNYEQIVKDKKLFMQKMKENPFFSRLPSCTLKEIQSKVYNTDIFFAKSQKSNNKYNSFINKIKHTNNSYYNSDIFNIKNDEISLQKIGENYLFHIPHKIKYTSSRESKSEWSGNKPKDSINNCSSKDYNILVPNAKNKNLRKETIYKTFDETNNAINNPIYKQKSISKYIDLASHSSSNFGKDYMNCYNLNPNCFKTIPENCSSFGDLFLTYKGISNKPFYKANN
jgi:hypothetical protein